MSISRDDLGAIDLSDTVAGETVPHTVPGDILLEDFMKPAGLSAYALAKAITVPANRITAILHGDRAISADTAIRLGRRFGTTAEFWMNLQVAYDLARAWEMVVA